MDRKKHWLAITSLLVIGFIDYLGIGLIFPLVAPLFFNSDVALVSPATSQVLRGTLMGVLIALGPFVQFFSSPFLGTLSDQKGRKKILVISLIIATIGYLIGALSIHLRSLLLFCIYRIFFGFSAGSAAVVQASLADVSSKEEKAKNFGLFGMALGLGFTIGPFVGGRFSDSEFVSWFTFSTPFLFAGVMAFLSLCLVMLGYRDTRPQKAGAPVRFLEGILHLKKAWDLKEVRIILLVMFVFLFGWDFYVEFIPVFLIDKFDFTPAKTGNFYALSGALYAISSGLLIRPLTKRIAPLHLMLPSMILAGFYMLGILLLNKELTFWLYFPPLTFFMALIYPTATAELSNRVAVDAQGEVLGIYGSVQALALILSPLFLGGVVGKHANFSIILGGGLMVLAGVILLLNEPWKNWEQNWRA